MHTDEESGASAKGLAGMTIASLFGDQGIEGGALEAIELVMRASLEANCRAGGLIDKAFDAAIERCVKSYCIVFTQDLEKVYYMMDIE